MVGNRVTNDTCTGCTTNGWEECADICASFLDCAAWNTQYISTNNTKCYLHSEGYLDYLKTELGSKKSWFWGPPCEQGNTPKATSSAILTLSSDGKKVALMEDIDQRKDIAIIILSALTGSLYLQVLLAPF